MTKKDTKISKKYLTEGAVAIYNDTAISEEQLEAKSDEQLALLAFSGNETASDTLIERFSPLVRRLARPYFLVGGDAEDLVQEGMIGLIKAMRTFDAERNVSFKTYASACIKSKLLSALESALRKKHSPLNQYISLEAPFFDRNPEQTAFLEKVLGTAVDPAEYVIGNEAMEELSQTLNGILSDFEAKTLAMYLEGRSYQEISEITSKSPKSVDNAVQRIRRKLLAKLSENGESRH